MKKPDKKQKFEIRDVFGIHELDIEVRPGVNRLRGRNGAGKTNAAAAIARASGDDSFLLTPRDGAGSGSVVGPGGVVLKVGSKVTRSGHASVELADYGALADLIQPRAKDRAAAARQAFAGLLRLVPIELTEPELYVLAGGGADDKEPDTEASDIVAGVEAKFEGEPVPISSAAREIKATAEGLARLWEGRRDEAVGAIKAEVAALEETQGEPVLSGEFAKKSEEELVREHRDAISAHARVQGLLEGRAEQEKALADAEKVAGDQSVDELRKAHASILAEGKSVIAEIERLEKKKGELEVEAAKILERGKSAKRIQELREGLAEGISGSELKDAATAVEAAEARLVAFRVSADRSSREDRAAAFSKERDEHDRRAKAFRKLAKGTSLRVGKILAERGVPGLTIDSDELHVLDEKTGVVGEPFARLSLGQRSRIALELAARFSPGKTLPLDPAFWLGLDPKHRQEVHELAVEAGLAIVTEEPSDEDGISVEYGTNEKDAALTK